MEVSKPSLVVKRIVAHWYMREAGSQPHKTSPATFLNGTYRPLKCRYSMVSACFWPLSAMPRAFRRLLGHAGGRPRLRIKAYNPAGRWKKSKPSFKQPNVSFLGPGGRGLSLCHLLFSSV